MCCYFISISYSRHWKYSEALSEETNYSERWIILLIQIEATEREDPERFFDRQREPAPHGAGLARVSLPAPAPVPISYPVPVSCPIPVPSPIPITVPVPSCGGGGGGGHRFSPRLEETKKQVPARHSSVRNMFFHVVRIKIVLNRSYWANGNPITSFYRFSDSDRQESYEDEVHSTSFFTRIGQALSQDMWGG